MRILEERDFIAYPKFKHNLWLKPEENPEITYLTTSNGVYEVPSDQADQFLSLRRYCTGYHSVEDISNRTNLSPEKIKEIFDPFHEAGMTHSPIRDAQSISDDEVEKTFTIIADLFGEHLAHTSITKDFLSGKLKKEIVFGWLSETYHFIKFFPDVLHFASQFSSGKIKEIIAAYAQEEKGHESFILETLEKSGFKKEEIEQSIPLVSTRTTQFILQDLFQYEPASVFIVASIVEAADYHDSSKQKFSKVMKKNYGFPLTMWDPFFKHIEIDHSLAHQRMLEKYMSYVRKIDREKLNNLVNKLHDLKHAFDLQKLEIIHHYGNSGSYIPRQFIGFFSI